MRSSAFIRVALTVSALTAGALAASACAPRLSHAELARIKSAGSVAVLVAPRKWTAQEVLGKASGADKLARVYGGDAPWRGDRLVKLEYTPGNGISATGILFPVGVDLRKVARARFKASAQRSLSLAVAESGGPLFQKLARETYSAHGGAAPIDFASDDPLSADALKAIAGEGIAALAVVAPFSVVLTQSTNRIAVVMKLSIYDTASGALIHESNLDLAGAVRDVDPKVLTPFFPKVIVTETVFGAGEVEAYQMALAAKTEDVTALEDMLGAMMEKWFDEELARMPG